MNIKQPPCYDVSHWKEIPDFRLIYPRPFLMITKATEATNIVDSKFAQFMAGMKQINCHRGCYHFFRNAYDGGSQARFFVAVVNGYIDNETILILDVEEDNGKNSPVEMGVWFDFVKKAYPNNRVMLYSRKNILDKIPMTTAQRTYFKGIPTWTAGYPDNPDLFFQPPAVYVPDPTKYGPVYLWQYSDDGIVEGIFGDVDLNWVSPNLQFFLGTPTQPPQEANMNQWYRFDMAGVVRNVRAGIGASYADKGDILLGDQIETDGKMVGGWYNVLSIKRAGGTVVPMVQPAWCLGTGFSLVTDPVQPPAPPPASTDPDYILAHFPDGTNRKYIPE